MSGVRLFHFSESNAIDRFEPRPVKVPAKRPPGREWLNGPLVWAIDEWHQPMYLFPRDCPRILLWPTHGTTKEDVDHYFGASKARMVAYVESAWLSRLESQPVYRYELPTAAFQSLDDAGMWVSKTAVEPVSLARIDDLPGQLAQENVELRVLDTLTPLKNVWETSLHASGIRLRHAQGWE